MRTKTFLHWMQAWMPRVLVGMEGQDHPNRLDWSIHLIWDFANWINS